MRFARGTAVAAVAVALALPGCASDPFEEGPAPGIRVDAPGASLRMNSVNILDKSLQDWSGRGDRKSKIAIERTNAKRTPTGTLQAWAVIRNRTDHPLQVEGRVSFFDAEQAHAEGPTPWQRLYLDPNSAVTFRENSTHVSGVSYYYIELREAR